jgi:phage shock protein PspC (stress-responsive transcriptional regulator)
VVAERLYRSRDDRMLAGVAAGVADTLDADPSLVRIIWALLAILTGGIAFVVYIVMAIVVPEAPSGYRPQGPNGWPAAGGGAGFVPPPPAGPATPADPPTPTAADPGPSAAFTGAPAAAAPPQPTYWTSDREARRAARRARRSSGGGGLIAGVVLIVIGGLFLAREVVPGFDWHIWWPLGLIGLGGLLLVLALLPGRSSD